MITFAGFNRPWINRGGFLISESGVGVWPVEARDPVEEEKDTRKKHTAAAAAAHALCMAPEYGRHWTPA